MIDTILDFLLRPVVIYPLGIIVAAAIVYLSITWGYDGDWSCLVSECRKLK